MTFDLQPILQGELVHLRPLRSDDYEALYQVAADKLIWEQHHDQTRAEKAGFKRFFAQALASGGAFLVTDARTGQVIGSSRYHGYDPERSEIEIGWTFLARSHWGGRYNGEMKHLMLQHAFQFVENVVFLIAPDNMRSQHATQKIGAVREGMRRTGDGRESLVFRLTAQAFRGGASRS